MLTDWGREMNKLLLAALPLMLTLIAGCNSEPEVKLENASVGEVAGVLRGKHAEEKFINPGQWQQTVRLLEIEAPGIPAEIRSSMQQAMKQVQVHDVCLSVAEARSPKEDFFAGADKNCRYAHFRWGGGKVDLKLDCRHPNASQTMLLTGDYKPDSYGMNMTATSAGAGPAEQMVLKMRVDAKRVGECDPAKQG